MKKSIIIGLFLIFLNLNLFSQVYSSDTVQDTAITKRIGYLGLGYNVLLTNSETMNGFYVQYEYLVNKSFSLNYSIGFNAGSKTSSFHTTLGSAGAFYLLGSLLDESNSKDEDCCEYCDDDDPDKCDDNSSGYAAFALLLLIPEGFTIYTAPDKDICPAIYFNFLSYEHSDKDNGEFRICPSIGLKCLIKLKENAFIEPQFGVKLNMPGSDYGFNFGIGLKF